MSSQHRPGTLIIIGGHEEKDTTDECLILRTVAHRVGTAPLVVATVATAHPEASYDEYDAVFRRLGVRHVRHLTVSEREDATSPQALRTLEGAGGVFFTGGDQLRITSQLGDTPVWDRLHEIFHSGGLIAGTSAGASVMCETMLVEGDSDTSPTRTPANHPAAVAEAALSA